MGGAVGGMGELAALEHVRLDLADGNLDGQDDVGQQPANFDPTTGAPLAPVASATIVPDNKVQVQVPAYGGGGVTGVMYNGDMISVEIPKDALGGTTIWVDVPEAYRKWTGGWG